MGGELRAEGGALGESEEGVRGWLVGDRQGAGQGGSPACQGGLPKAVEALEERKGQLQVRKLFLLNSFNIYTGDEKLL